MIERTGNPTKWILLAGLAAGWASCSGEPGPYAALPPRLADKLEPAAPPTAAGQTATLLPDGRWLLAGGGRDGEASTFLALVSAQGTPTGTQPGPLAFARSRHAATLLAEGRVLISGGVGTDGRVVETAELFDPASASVSQPTFPSALARASHSTTLLPDGRVLFAGGLASSGATLATAALWDPRSATVLPLGATLETGRSGHSAALLPSGRVLLWGGRDAAGVPVSTPELYDPAQQRFIPFDEAQEALLSAALAAQPPAFPSTTPEAKSIGFDPGGILSVLATALLDPTSVGPASVTLIGPKGPVDAAITAAEGGRALFVTPRSPLLPSSPHTLFVKGAVAADGTKLPFFAFDFTTGSAQSAQAAGLPPASQSASTVSGQPGKGAASPSVGGVVQPPTFNFEPASSDPGVWLPSAANLYHHWQTPLPHLPPSNPPQAPAGVTALAGQVLHLDGRPFPGYRMTVGSQTVLTDAHGYFLLQGLATGGGVLDVDGRSVSTKHAWYGRYFVHVELAAGATTVLPYIIWSARLDPQGTVTIPSPTVQETIVSTPSMPGLELHLPPGTVIRDHEGQIVTEVNLTPLPVNQPPFPLPDDVHVPVYFTIQPGGATLSGLSSGFTGAQLYYPNYTGQVPRATAVFWNYDPQELGWFTYGMGTVSADGRQVVPDPGVVIDGLSGAMINDGDSPPPPGEPPNNDIDCSTCADNSAGTNGTGSAGNSGGDSGGDASGGGGGGGAAAGGGGGGGGGRGGGAGGGGGGGSGLGAGGGADNGPEDCPDKNSSQGGSADPNGGDPVELATGQFTRIETDLEVQDVFPIRLSRIYRSLDVNQRSFGIGTSLTYEVFQYSPNQYQVDEVILPNGGRVIFNRTTTGNEYNTSRFETTAPGSWAGSRVEWDTQDSGWLLFFRDGRIWHFGEVRPLQYMEDRDGNRLIFTRQSGTEEQGGMSGPIMRITTPSGRWVALTYDAYGHVTQAQDNAGRTVSYGYNSAHTELTSVTDADGNTHSFVWGTSGNDANELTEVVDARGTVLVHNHYDGTGRVVEQDLADSTSFLFDFDAGPSQVAETDRNGNQRLVTINDAGYETESNFPSGTPIEQDVSFGLDPA
ncbi:MAG: DUF6531 domain-containing protein, partial [Myxococcales bacterium]